jgi:hypothetical protein
MGFAALYPSYELLRARCGRMGRAQQNPSSRRDSTLPEAALNNRVHHELWRYYPQMPKLTKDLAAPWFLELWTIAPTPAKARQLRKSTVEQLLKQHRIRRVDAETVIRTLREPAIKVAGGVAEAASVHMRSLIARLHVINRELQEAERQLDEICTAIGEAEAVSGDSLQRQDIMILKSMPGIGRINLAALLSEGSGPLSRRDLPGASDIVRCRSGHQTQWQVAHRHHALRCSCPVAQHGLSLGTCRYPARPQKQKPLRRPTPTRSLARPCAPKCSG